MTATTSSCSGDTASRGKSARTGIGAGALRKGQFLAVGAAMALALSGVIAAPSMAVAGQADVAVKILVLDDGSDVVGAIKDRLTKEGVPSQVVSLTDASRPQLTSTFLGSTDATGAHGNFSGVVVPTDAPTQLSATELTTLNAYEAAFGVREVSAYDWANPTVGLNYAANPGYVGPVDGMTATVTTTGRAGAFSYLKGTLTLDNNDPNVQESYGYLATPLATDPNGGVFTPLVTAKIPGTTTQGSLIGQYTQGGRERLIVTFASNQYQQHFKVLSHGIVSWLTRGVSASMNRNYLSVHVDDVFLADAVWSIPGKCTIGDGCDPVQYPDTAPGATVRMLPSDVTRLNTWQNANGIKLDMVYNGDGQAQYLEDNNVTTDPLTTAFKSSARSLRWINHTWSHQFMGCQQTSNTPPWTCLTDAAGNTLWYPQASVESEISQNRTWATNNGFPITANELVSGEHSGLKTLPQQPVDNPNFVAALGTTGIKWIASDASREAATRTAGTAQTVPRYPMNIFYNVSTKAEETAEYNWIYTSRANGGSGLCEDNPTTSTCITPLDNNTGFDSYIRPLEAKIAFGHVADNDARPHYVHQSNLAGDAILYPVLTDVINRYKATYATTAALVNPTMSQAGDSMVKQQKWANDSSAVTMRIQGTSVVLTNTSNRTIQAPVTVPNGTKQGSATFGEAYGGQRSAWLQMSAGQKITLTLPAASGYTSPTAWPAAGTMAVASLKSAPMAAGTPSTTVVEVPAVKSDVVEEALAGN